MKKFLGLVIALVLGITSVTTFFLQTTPVSAQSFDEADNYFLEFVLSDTTFQGEIDFTHTPLYDDQLNVNGREYNFTVGNVGGYALMTQFYGNGNVFYEIEELFYNKVSPFAGCNGLPIYITHNVYLEYKDQGFYNLTSGALVDGQTLLEYKTQGFNYFGGASSSFTTVHDTVNFATKTTDEYSIEYDLPDFCGTNGSSCANVAGAVVIAYYDRFYINLIPNYDPYFTFAGLIFWNEDATTQGVINELSQLMLIGEPHEGTTFTEFQYGMQTFVERQGYTYTSNSVFSNGSLNFNAYKNAVENDIPVALFLTNFAMINGINEHTQGVDTISSGYCPVSHVVVGCGYRVDTYYNANNSVIQTNKYLKVACGLTSYGIGYLNINGRTTISKAISIQIS